MKNILISLDQENSNDNIEDTILSAAIKSDTPLTLEECLASVCMIYKCIANQTDITREEFSKAVFSYLDKAQFEENNI